MKQNRNLVTLLIILLLSLLENIVFVLADEGYVSAEDNVKDDSEIPSDEYVSMNEEEATPGTDSKVEETVPRGDTSTTPEESNPIPDAVESDLKEPMITESVKETAEAEAPPSTESKETMTKSSSSNPSKESTSMVNSSCTSTSFIKNKLSLVVDKVKGLTPAQVKKAAAASLGIWGAAAGIRFALQRSADNEWT